jgi:hypothetical protein
MSTHRPSLSESAKKNFSTLADILKRISYKPGWNIEITENPNEFGFTVTIIYEGYESDNAAFSPLSFEDPQVATARERLQVSIGKHVRHRERRCFRRNFDFWSLETMSLENLVMYVIADTIKQAEMFEFDRWLKFNGDRVFGRRNEYDSRN